MGVAESAQGVGPEVEPITPVDTTSPSMHFPGAEEGVRATPEDREVREGEEEEEDEEEEEEEVEDEEEEEEGEFEEDEEESPSQDREDFKRASGFPRVSCALS